MEFKIIAMTSQAASKIATWQYPDPFTIYSLSALDIPILTNPKNEYFPVLDMSDSIVGYCCFGLEARVKGGVYRGGEESVLDLGLGMRPEITGKGLGKSFAHAILNFAQLRFQPKRYRVTVAEFNKRSMRVFQSLNFEETHCFNRPGDDLEFVQLERVSTLGL